MIRFSIFGIPIEIQPFFWVITALLGGAITARTADEIFAVVLFILAALISIIIHELGHACTGLKLGGGRASILLTSFGGLAYNQGGRFNRQQRFWMIFAGPGAGFAFLIVLVAALSLIFGTTDVLNFTSYILFGIRPDFQSIELVSFLREKFFVFLFLKHLLWINFWWGMINLLPVMPLDGGQITDLFVRPQRRVYLIGLVAASSMAALSLFWLQSGYTAMLFAFFAWKNYESMQSVRWQ
jgi:Zn-dependent protease